MDQFRCVPFLQQIHCLSFLCFAFTAQFSYRLTLLPFLPTVLHSVLQPVASILPEKHTYRQLNIDRVDRMHSQLLELQKSVVHPLASVVNFAYDKPVQVDTILF